MSKRYGKGSWVIITGGSSGIGFEFAKEFVKRNFNIIIIARNQDKLDKSAQEIRNLNSNVKVKTITFDFGIQSAVKDYDDLWDKIQKIETSESQISILINNVGVTWSKMSETSLKNQSESTTTSCLPTVMMSKCFIDRIQCSTRNRKAVINMSGAGHILIEPDKAIYNGAKHHINFFSVGENINWSPKGCDFLCVMPGQVNSGVTNYRKEDMVTSSANETVLGALRALGKADETYGANKHIVMWNFIENVFCIHVGRIFGAKVARFINNNQWSLGCVYWIGWLVLAGSAIWGLGIVMNVKDVSNLLFYFENN